MDIEKAIREIDWYLTANPLCSSQERYYEFKDGLAEALKILKILNDDKYIRKRLCLICSEKQSIQHD